MDCTPSPVKGSNGSLGTSSARPTADPLVAGPSYAELTSNTPPVTDIRRSVCQSPSWEAYTQRKQEKKGAKKEKEQATKQAKSKPRRLSKPPPPSPTLSPYGRTRSESGGPPKTATTRRERPASVLGVLGLSTDDLPPPRPQRSRASSFSSLIKAPFEHRRPSIDSAPNMGFIGGIKLEHKRHLANEETLDHAAYPAHGTDDLGIHPAFREEKKRTGLSHSEAQQSGMRGPYPPISMQTSTSATTQALVAPGAQPKSELSTINKWRARVGLRSSKSSEKKSNSMPVAKAPVSTQELLFGPIHNAPPAAPSPLTNMPAARVSSPALLSTTNPMLLGAEGRIPRKAVPPSPVDSEDYAEPPASPPPPAPPRKSSKRVSRSSLDIPRLLPQPSTNYASSIESPETSPGIHLDPSSNRAALRRATIDMESSKDIGLGGPKRTFRETARAAFGKPPAKSSIEATSGGEANGLKPASPGSSWRHAELAAVRPQTSSSEGSLSEDYHSATSVTTPDSSRAHSEKNFASSTPNVSGSTGRRSSDLHPGGPSHSGSRLPMDDELDPIQIAAQKVRAAFPDHGNQTSRGNRRGTHESATSWDSSRSRHAPRRTAERMKTRPPPLSPEFYQDDGDATPIRELILSKDQSCVSAPWPATYLEAARKAAPPRAGKPGNQPSPPLPALGSAAPAPLRSQTSLSSGSDGAASSPSPRSPVSPPTTDSSHCDPLAKMFVECCGCRYYHDMPSKLYEAMSHPEGVLGEQRVDPGVGMDYAGSLSTTVRCPWCQHGMSTKCCAGLVAMVYVKERLH